MIKAEKNVLEAFTTPAGQIISEFLSECLKDKLAKLMVSEKIELYRTQGTVQELNEIVALANNARNILHS